MPQTVDSVPKSCFKIEIATASPCTSWTEISGSSNSITGTTQTKMVGDEYTADGNYAISEVGKYQPFDITVRMVFTHTAGEAYRRVRDRFLAGACTGRMCLRWIPGGAVGNAGFETNYAPIVSFDWPEVNAGEAGPIMANFVLHVASIDPFTYVS